MATARLYIPQRAASTPVPRALTNADVMVDQLLGATSNALPSAASVPGLAIEITNRSLSSIDVTLQAAGDIVNVDGTSITTAPVSAGASHVYVSDGVNTWYEF